MQIIEGMESIASIFSWPRVALSIAAYFLTLVFYRLWLHPLSRFPGPKLAAISRWYEGYWDLVHNGQYTFRIAEFHKQYGGYCHRLTPASHSTADLLAHGVQAPSYASLHTSCTSMIPSFSTSSIDKMGSGTNTIGPSTPLPLRVPCYSLPSTNYTKPADSR